MPTSDAASEGAVPETSPGGCCALEAVVSVDERGQLVLPKEVRTRMGILPGERLALVSYRGENGDLCCLTLVKTETVAGAVRSVIGPALGL